ncbi:MAG: helix-turn-helix domain-containing protein [Gracilibacteraceae bacterium]|nr:helix-turn-helix domain-containing protein [Gracilibacteraceae bacterium]
MTQTRSSPKRHSRVSYPVLKAATGGDIEAMMVIQRHFEPYMRRLATVDVCGTSYLNTDLYDRLKTRLIMATLKFRC